MAVAVVGAVADMPADPLWAQIAAFVIDDDPTAPVDFLARLCREQRYTPVFGARVVDEYRRFIYLAMIADHVVSPSKAVDHAWHLHLLYTRSYWDRLCAGVLGRPLHHTPSKGGADDVVYRDFYRRTKTTYERTFAAPPPRDIWP